MTGKDASNELELMLIYQQHHPPSKEPLNHPYTDKTYARRVEALRVAIWNLRWEGRECRESQKPMPQECVDYFREYE